MFEHAPNSISMYILLAVVVFESIYEQILKHRMVQDDEEYKEPNKAFFDDYRNRCSCCCTPFRWRYVHVHIRRWWKMENDIKKLRKAAGLRQEDLANQVGVSRQTIIAVENNKYDPTLELAMKLAKALEKNVEDIFFLN